MGPPEAVAGPVVRGRGLASCSLGPRGAASREVAGRRAFLASAGLGAVGAKGRCAGSKDLLTLLRGRVARQMLLGEHGPACFGWKRLHVKVEKQAQQEKQGPGGVGR